MSLYKVEIERDGHSGIPCEDGDRNQSDASPSQGMHEVASKPPEVRWEAWNIIQCLWKESTRLTLSDFWLPELWDNKFLLCHPVYGAFWRQLWQTNIKIAGKKDKYTKDSWHWHWLSLTSIHRSQGYTEPPLFLSFGIGTQIGHFEKGLPYYGQYSKG